MGSVKAGGNIAQWREWAAQGTTNDYADLGEPWDKSGQKSATVLVRNTGEAGATVKVLGSVDGGKTFDAEAGQEATVAAAGTTTFAIDAYYTHLKIQIKAEVADSQTAVAAAACAIAA